jgi:hypothetical protein
MAADVLAPPIPSWILQRVGVFQKKLRLSDENMAIMVYDSKRCAAAQCSNIPAIGRYSGGMRALGMRSRIPAGRA